MKNFSWKFHGRFSMEFHGQKPKNSMKTKWSSMWNTSWNHHGIRRISVEFSYVFCSLRITIEKVFHKNSMEYFTWKPMYKTYILLILYLVIVHSVYCSHPVFKYYSSSSSSSCGDLLCKGHKYITTVHEANIKIGS